MRSGVFLFLFLLLELAPSVVTATLNGERSVYLPLVAKPAPPLPAGPLLLVYQDRNLVWVNPDGTYRRQITTAGNNKSAIVSPNGQSIIYHQENANSPSRHLLLPATGGTPREIPIYISRRSWSPDSRYVAWIEYNNTSYNVYTYNVATGETVVIDRNADDPYTWHPLTGQIYFLSEISDTDVSLYRSNADGSGRTLTLDTPDREWMLQAIPDGRVLVSAYTPERYHIGAIQPDGSNYTLLEDLRRGVIVVATSPYGSGFFYELSDVLYLDDITGRNVNQVSLGCDPPYDSCSKSPTRWSPTALAFAWEQYETGGDFTDTLYTLATTPGATPTLIASGHIGEFQYSPDGHYLAYEVNDDLVIYDVTTRQVVLALPDTELEMWRP